MFNHFYLFGTCKLPSKYGSGDLMFFPGASDRTRLSREQTN